MAGGWQCPPPIPKGRIYGRGAKATNGMRSLTDRGPSKSIKLRLPTENRAWPAIHILSGRPCPLYYRLSVLGGNKPMRIKRGGWSNIAIVFLVSGCASVVGDQTQPVSVDTPSCPKANCRLTNSQGTYFVKSTPETVVINKAYSDLTLTCEKDGKTATSVHMSQANAATFGNILLGGIPGALIDGGSGAGYDYPGYLVNDLKCPDSPRQTSTVPASTGAPASAVPPTFSKTVEDRLRELKQLEEKGLISGDEAKKKRQNIIDSM